MKKLIFYLLFIIPILFSCNKKNEITIGAILPLTGDAAQWGIPPQKAALLAVEEINANGGINGKKIKLVIEDSQCDPSKGVAGINKLLSINKPIAIVGAVCSSVTLAIAPIAEKNKIVLISPASTNPQITNAGDYIFRVIPSDELRGKVFAEYVYSQSLKNGAILYINNDGGKGNEETFKKYFELNGGKISIDESYMPQAQSVKTQLTKIREVNSEFLMVVSYPNDAVMVLKDISEIKFNKPLFFQTEALDDPTVLKNAGETAENVVFITYAEADNGVSKNFKLAYKSKYNTEPELFAAEAYDAIYLISKAIKEGIDIKEYLYSIKNYSGASGTLTFDINGDVIKPLAIKQVKGQTSEILEIK